MQPDNELIKVLRTLSAGELTPDDLRDWLGRNIWRLVRSPSAFDRQAVMELDMALADLDDGLSEP